MDDGYEVLAAFYDHIYAFRTQDVAFYVTMAREGKAPILEAGCGTGRITVPLIESGCETHGLDTSPAMLRVLRRKLADQPQSLPCIHEGDMRAFDLGKKFAQVFVPFRAFLHLDTIDDQLSALRNFHKHLLPDSQLMMQEFVQR